MLELHGLFSLNSAVTVGSPPRETWLTDVAIDPATGEVYSIHLGDGLVRLSSDLDSLILIGEASYARNDVNGIASPQFVKTGDFLIINVVRDSATRALTITWNSQGGQTYRIELSSNLSEWTKVAEDITGQEGITSFSDDFAARTSATAGYYRVIIP